jgi:hypothetical protein
MEDPSGSGYIISLMMVGKVKGNVCGYCDKMHV